MTQLVATIALTITLLTTMTQCAIGQAQAVVSSVSTATQVQPTADLQKPQIIAQRPTSAPPSLESTVRIKFLAGPGVVTEADGIRTTTYADTSGLGTLVTMNGQRQVVTHNHWASRAAGTTVLVQILSHEGVLLSQLDAAAFEALVAFEDAGTLLFTAPVELHHVPTTPYAPHTALQAGQVVYAVFVTPNKTLVMQEAVYIDMMGAGIVTYRLQSLQGNLTTPGNSGGGVWHNGQLIGNTWSTLLLGDGSPTTQTLVAPLGVG